MNFYKLLLGVMLIVVSIAGINHIFKVASKDENYSQKKMFTYDFKLIIGAVFGFVIGLILIYREIFE